MRRSVVVIGLGPAGAVAARVLADRGIHVVALQATAGADGRAGFVSPSPTVRRGVHDIAIPASSPQAGADRIGGSKHLAAAQSYRLTAETFAMGWPLTLDELLDHYELVERTMRVGPRPRTPWTMRMAGAARALGNAPFDAPAAASRDVSPLVVHPNIEIVRGTALHITTDVAGAASGVEYLDGEGMTRALTSDAVVVAGSVVPSVRLLLLSGIDGGGTVGGSFSSHNSFVVNGWFPATDLARDKAGPATAVAVTEFESAPAAAGFVGGSILQAAMTGPRTAAWERAMAASAPGDDVGEGAEWIARHKSSIGTVWAQPDQLPHSPNRIDLDPQHLDALGRRVARLTFDLAEDDRLRAAHLAEPMAQWLFEAGATRTWSAPLEPQPLGTHLYGGATMGIDPATSVVDGYGRCHTVPGLVVAGSATFPTTGGRGPVETIEALAWRFAERLADDLG